MCRQFDSSQHHSNPLIFSGLFVSDTFSDTFFVGNTRKRGATEMPFGCGPGHRTEGLGEAAEAAEGEFEPGDGVVEFVLVQGDGGAGEEGVYLVQEFVDGDLVDTGGAGLVVEAKGAVFVSFIGLEGCGIGIGFRCGETGYPGAGSGPSGFAVDASVHIGTYES